MSVKQAILDFTDGEIRTRIFVAPDIPTKKLNAARSQFISRDEEVIVLYDDTLFGSCKDGIAITENYIYTKQLWEDPKSIKISSIRSIASQSKSLNNLEIYINNNHLITVSPSDKADQEFLIGILETAKNAAAKPPKKKEKAAPVAQVSPTSPAHSKPRAKARGPSPQAIGINSSESLSCNDCNADLPVSAKFCLECGAKVLPKGVCLECNAKLPENAKFCPGCGTPAGKQSGANSPSVKPSGPQIDIDAARRELVELLADPDRDVSVDSDGDLRINFTTKKVPSFVSRYRGSAMTYAIRVSSEGQTEEDVSRDTRLSATDDGVWFGGPYVRVGKLLSAHYEAQVDAKVWATDNLEVHEVKLTAGNLDVPTLGSSRISLTSLKATKDDSDGSYGVEYELKAYPNHYVHFEIVTERPSQDADLWPTLDCEDSRSGNSWLYGVKQGDPIYVLFAEYEKVVDGVGVTLSGTAEPMEGSYDVGNEAAESQLNKSSGGCAMKFDLKVVYNNADSGETDEQTLTIETENEKIQFLGTVCSSRPTHQTFEQLFKNMYDNPTMDGAEKGELYDELWPIMSRWAFDKLGWHDVTVDVIGLMIDGEDSRLGQLVEIGMIDNRDWSLQLSREGFMYCYV